MMETLHPDLTQFFFLMLGAVLSIATLMLTLHHLLRKDMSALRTEVKEDIKEVRVDVSNLRKEVNSLGQRLAKLERTTA